MGRAWCQLPDGLLPGRKGGGSCNAGYTLLQHMCNMPALPHTVLNQSTISPVNAGIVLVLLVSPSTSQY